MLNVANFRSSLHLKPFGSTSARKGSLLSLRTHPGGSILDYCKCSSGNETASWDEEEGGRPEPNDFNMHIILVLVESSKFVCCCSWDSSASKRCPTVPFPTVRSWMLPSSWWGSMQSCDIHLIHDHHKLMKNFVDSIVSLERLNYNHNMSLGWRLLT